MCHGSAPEILEVSRFPSYSNWIILRGVSRKKSACQNQPKQNKSPLKTNKIGA
jgi:hypothetical protein